VVAVERERVREAPGDLWLLEVRSAKRTASSGLAARVVITSSRKSCEASRQPWTGALPPSRTASAEPVLGGGANDRVDVVIEYSEPLGVPVEGEPLVRV
jgi:hypothetical protein